MQNLIMHKQKNADNYWLLSESTDSELDNATPLIFVQQTRHAQVATINGWRPCLLRRRTPPLEQSAGMRHLDEYTANFQETLKNPPV